MRRARPLFLLACLLAAGGCARLEGIMAPSGGEPVADMKALDGRYAGTASTKPIANAARPAKNRPVPNARRFAFKTFINPSLIGRENHAVSRF